MGSGLGGRYAAPLGPSGLALPRGDSPRGAQREDPATCRPTRLASEGSRLCVFLWAGTLFTSGKPKVKEADFHSFVRVRIPCNAKFPEKR